MSTEKAEKSLDKVPDLDALIDELDLENTDNVSQISKKDSDLLLNCYDEKEEELELELELESAEDGQSLQEETNKTNERVPSSMIANVSEEMHLSDLATRSTSTKEHDLPSLVIRSIGSMDVSVLPKDGVFDLIDIVFGSPILLLLHVYHVKHELKFLKHSSEHAAIHVSFSQGSDSYDLTVEKGGLKVGNYFSILFH